mgnify:CR=1 FL=1
MEKFMNLPEEKAIQQKMLLPTIRYMVTKNLWQKDITCQLVKSQKF